MERRERWPEDGNPWCDHVRDHDKDGNHHDQQNRSQSVTKFQILSREFRQYFLPLVRRFREKILNTFDRSTLAETLQYSVLMMLISFATFLMCCTFVILGGSLLIVMLSITITVKSGRKIQVFARSIRERLSGARAVPEAVSVKNRTTSTSAGTLDSNS